jgi:hypothetical protein
MSTTSPLAEMWNFFGFGTTASDLENEHTVTAGTQAPATYTHFATLVTLSGPLHSKLMALSIKTATILLNRSEKESQ